MARLPTIERQNVVTPQVQSAVSPAEVARYSGFGVAADALGFAGQRITALADQAEHAEATAYLARASNDARTAALEIAQKTGGNAEAFRTAWESYSANTLAKAPERFRPNVEASLVTVGGERERDIMGATFKAGIESAKGTITGEIDALSAEAATYARLNGTSSEDYTSRRDKIVSLYGDLAANPAFGMTPEQVALDLKRLESQHMAEAIVGEIDRTYRDKGVAEAEKAARTLLWDPQLALSPDERRVYVSRATEYLQGTAAGRKVALQQARDQATEIGKMLDADPRLVDDTTVDRAMSNLAGLGDAAGALDLARKRAGVRFLSGTFAGAGDRGQVGLYQRMFSADGQGIAGLIGRARDAVASIESAGSGGYAAVGPETKTGDHAYGKYQVMGANIPAWTRETLGREMTPEQFLADEKAQDAVFDDQFGKLVARYGNALDAASAWFTGRPRATGADAQDVLGTSGTDYVRKFAEAMGGATAPYSPAGDPEVVKAMRSEITADLKTHWTSIKDGLAKNLPPSAAELDLIAGQLAIVDDPELKNEIAGYFRDHADGYLLQNVPPAQAEALLARMTSDQNGYDAGQVAAVNAAQDAVANAKKQLQDDPLGFAVGRQLADAPPPIDPANPESLAAGLTARQGIADVVDARYQTGAVSALRPAEADAVATYWKGADTNQRLALLGAMTRTLKPDTLMATLGGFAGKDADLRTLAVAGALSATDPETGAAVVRGQAALATNPKFGFDPGNASDREARDGYFPTTALAPTMTEAWQAHMDAARAIYADASARAGDASGAFNRERWQAAVDQVTGGMVEMNGAKTVSPRRDIDQKRFDEIMAALPDRAFAGAVTPDGTPLTADFVRRRGKLQGYADGRYVVALGDTGAYALGTSRIHPEIGFTGPFVLDLRSWLNVQAPETRASTISAFDPIGDARRVGRAILFGEPMFGGR